MSRFGRIIRSREGLNVIAVILSAGAVPHEIATLFRCPSIGLVPINGRPLITLQLEKLREWGATRFKIALRRQDTRVREYISQYARLWNLAVEVVEIAVDRGPGGTLLQAVLPHELGQGVFVLLGDTLIENGGPEIRPARNQVFTAPVPDPERWCMVSRDDAGRVTSLHHKPSRPIPGTEAAVGCYWLGNVAPLTWSRLQHRATDRIELAAILEEVNRAHELAGTTVGGWLDCGNVDLLLATRRKLIAARSFNTLKIDELRGTVCKRSRNAEKFRHEINYYRLLPHDLSVFFPRLIAYETAEPNAHVELEYYAYPTLNEVYLYEEHGESFWRTVVQKIGAILQTFAARRVHIPPVDCTRFYRQKLEQRLEAAAGQSPELARLLGTRDLTVNGRRMPGVKRMVELLAGELERLGQTATGAVIHGDLCFANILIEPLTKTMRLIDPRGSFHEVGIFGDSRYDHAKLWHSVDGNYDVIISDMFSLQVGTASLDFDCFTPASRQCVLTHLETILPDTTSRRDVRLIEGSLFLSMIPLHADQPRRQLAMLGTTIRVTEEGEGVDREGRARRATSRKSDNQAA